MARTTTTAGRDLAARRPPKSARLYQQVAEKLARAIAGGSYKVGERLPAERELAASHGVSRPTVREAIIALELDGLVEVKVGSGVYVAAKPARGQTPVAMDIGPFELTEARLIVEGEIAALAATLITDAEVAELTRLLDQMEEGNKVGTGEVADRLFHLAIAAATRNSAMVALVDYFWTVRNRSPQCVLMFEKSRAKGYAPVVAEHLAIVEALRARDPVRARAAMREHLSRVLQYLLDASEVEALEAAKAQVAAQRDRFAVRA